MANVRTPSGQYVTIPDGMSEAGARAYVSLHFPETMQPPPPPKGFLDEMGTALGRGWQLGSAGLNIATMEGLRAAGLPGEETVQGWLAENMAEAQEYAPGESVTEGLEEITSAGSLGGAALSAIQNPTAVASVAMESLAQQVPALAGIIGATAIGSPVAGLGAVAANSFGMEYAHSIMDGMSKAGYDATDPEQIRQFYADEKALDEARKTGLKRGVPIAAFDVASFGIAGKLLGPALKSGSRARVAGAGVGELGLQAGSGMAGEATAQTVAGQERSWGDIALEGFAEIPFGAAEIATNLSNVKKPAPKGNAAEIEKEKEEQPEPQQIAAPKRPLALPQYDVETQTPEQKRIAYENYRQKLVDAIAIEIPERKPTATQEPAAKSTRQRTDTPIEEAQHQAVEVKQPARSTTRAGRVKYPIALGLQKAGIRIDPESPAGQELRAAGFNPRNMSRLFKRGSKRGLDNLSPEDIGLTEEETAAIGFDGNYLSERNLIEAMVRERSGEPIVQSQRQTTEDDARKIAREEIERVAVDELDTKMDAFSGYEVGVMTSRILAGEDPVRVVEQVMETTPKFTNENVGSANIPFFEEEFAAAQEAERRRVNRNARSAQRRAYKKAQGEGDLIADVRERDKLIADAIDNSRVIGVSLRDANIDPQGLSTDQLRNLNEQFRKMAPLDNEVVPFRRKGHFTPAEALPDGYTADRSVAPAAGRGRSGYAVTETIRDPAGRVITRRPVQYAPTKSKARQAMMSTMDTDELLARRDQIEAQARTSIRPALADAERRIGAEVRTAERLGKADDPATKQRIADMRRARDSFQAGDDEANEEIEAITGEIQNRMQEMRDAAVLPSSSDSQRQQMEKLDDEVAKAIERHAERLGLKEMGYRVRVGDAASDPVLAAQPGAEGYHHAGKKIVVVSRDAIMAHMKTKSVTPTAMKNYLLGVMDHELIHALSKAGKINDKDRAALRKYAAETDRVDPIDGSSSGKSYLQWAQDTYGGTNVSQEGIEEEAIAEAFRGWSSGHLKTSGKPKGVFMRIVDMFRRIIGIGKGTPAIRREAQRIMERMSEGTYAKLNRKVDGQVSQGDSIQYSMGDKAYFASLRGLEPFDEERGLEVMDPMEEDDMIKALQASRYKVNTLRKFTPLYEAVVDFFTSDGNQGGWLSTLILETADGEKIGWVGYMTNVGADRPEDQEQMRMSKRDQASIMAGIASLLGRIDYFVGHRVSGARADTGNEIQIVPVGKMLDRMGMPLPIEHVEEGSFVKVVNLADDKNIEVMDAQSFLDHFPIEQVLKSKGAASRWIEDVHLNTMHKVSDKAKPIGGDERISQEEYERRTSFSEDDDGIIDIDYFDIDDDDVQYAIRDGLRQANRHELPPREMEMRESTKRLIGRTEPDSFPKKLVREAKNFGRAFRYNVIDRVSPIGTVAWSLIKQGVVDERHALAEISAANAAHHANDSKAVTNALLSLGGLRFVRYENGGSELRVVTEDENGRPIRSFLDIMDEIHKKTGMPEEFQHWMASKRHVDIKRRIEEQNARRARAEAEGLKFDEPEVPPSGMTEEDVADGFAIYDSLRPETREIFDRASADMNTLMNMNVEAMYQGGLITGDERDFFLDSAYIPFFKRDAELFEREDGPRGEFYRNVRKTVNKYEKRKGGEVGDRRKFVPIEEAVADNFGWVVNSLLRNDAYRKTIRDMELMDAARGSNPEFQIPMANFPEDVPLIEEVDGRETHENMVTVLVDGKPKHYLIHDPLMYESMTSLGIPMRSLNDWFLGGAVKVLRESITKSPPFILANMLRDSVSAWALSGESMIPVIDTLRGYRKAMTNHPDAIALREAGVGLGYDRTLAGTNLGAKLRRQAKGGGNALERMWDYLDRMSSASDMATRIAIYNAVLKRGGSKAEAEKAAREILNFGRGGSNQYVQLMMSMVPFLNARLQGLDVLGRTMAGHGHGRGMDVSARNRQMMFLRRYAYLTALGVLYASMVSGEDWYEQQQPEVRDDNYLFNIGGVVVALPAPFEIGTMTKTIPEHVIRTLNGDQPARDLRKSAARALFGTFGFNPVPQLFMPTIEAASNYDLYFQRPITPIYQTQLDPSQQYDMRTSGLARGIASVLNAAGDWVSPNQVDHVIRGHTGTLGSWFLTGTDQALKAAGLMEDGPKWEVTDAPFFRRFLKSELSAGKLAQFYDLKAETDRAYRTLKHFEDEGDTKAARELRRERSNLLAIRTNVNRLDRQLRTLRNRRKAIEKNQTLSPDVKRDRINRIKEQENKVLKSLDTMRMRAFQ